MGFSSIASILEYNYKSKGDIYEALGALEAMYTANNIDYRKYMDVKALLEAKLKNLK